MRTCFRGFLCRFVYLKKGFDPKDGSKNIGGNRPFFMKTVEKTHPIGYNELYRLILRIHGKLASAGWEGANLAFDPISDLGSANDVMLSPDYLGGDVPARRAGVSLFYLLQVPASPSTEFFWKESLSCLMWKSAGCGN